MLILQRSVQLLHKGILVGFRLRNHADHVQQQAVRVVDKWYKENLSPSAVDTTHESVNYDNLEEMTKMINVEAANVSLAKEKIHFEYYDTMRTPEILKKKVAVNRFRPIIYSEGELDKSDPRQLPSRNNPHPFDPATSPSLLPATYSWSIVNHVNHIPMLQVLVELGMDLFEVDSTTNIGHQLVKLDWERDVRPKLVWLIHEVGMPVTDIGPYLTRNPYFFLENLNNMQVRLNYLYSKLLNKEQILRIVRNNRFWLNIDVKTTDARLGWLQKTFELTGDEIRQVLIIEPRIIMFGVGPLERLVILLTEEFEFAKGQVKTILLKDPRVYMMECSALQKTYHYLRFIMRITNMQIVDWPTCLRCSVATIRKRHEFLVKLHKADYNEGSPNYIGLSALLQPSDQKFALNVAHTYLTIYNAFLKNY